jgi:pyruvate,water dikinase
MGPGRSLDEVPDGVVLVVPQTTPELAPVLPRIAALLAGMGSATGHLTLVAREYGVPALVEVQGAAELPPGEVVTVDAFLGKVYQGRVEDLLRYQGHHPRHSPDSPILARVRAVTDLVIPLNLVDRRSQEFRPENCCTYHDIARFAQEKAMQLMFGLMDDVAQGRVPALKLLKLKTALPLNLHLVDLGDGLASHETPVPPEDIISRPMRALWRGISYPNITWAGPVPVNVGGFLHVLGQSAINPPEKFWDKTYAIVAANYVNYACRLGYHFQSVDSYIGDVPGNNYINFTFKGGAADDTRRIRRIRLIAAVLDRLGFTMEIFGDVIRARFRRRPEAEMEERLDLVGRLMAYVRQMDMLMKDDNISQVLAERFLAGHYDRPGEES